MMLSCKYYTHIQIMHYFEHALVNGGIMKAHNVFLVGISNEAKKNGSLSVVYESVNFKTYLITVLGTILGVRVLKS